MKGLTMQKFNIPGLSCAPTARRLRRPLAARALLEALEPRTLLTADLTGTFLTAPTRAFNGTSQSVTLSVANSGPTTASGTVAIAFYAAPDGAAFSVGTATPLTTISRSLNITAGHAQVISYGTLPLSAALVAGNYRIYAVIDSTNKIAETDESNNTVSSAVVVLAQLDYNLVTSFSAAATLPPAIIQGQVTKATVKVLVTNSSGGTAKIPAGQKVLLKLFARPVGGAADGSADTLLTATPLSASIGGLAPGKSNTLTANIQFPSTLASGTYNIFAYVDSTNVLAETDETDNQATFANTLKVAPAFSDPTLTFDPATVIPANAVSDGRKMPLKVDIENLGNVTIPGGQTSSISVVLVGGGHTSIPQNFAVNLGGLARGATRTFSLAAVVPAGQLDGAYTVQATLTTSAAGNVTGNDSASGATTITLGPAFYNLAVAPPTTTFNPAVINGDPTSGTVNVGIQNLSNTLLPAGAKVNITLMLHPVVAGTPDIAIGSLANVSLGSLAQGTTKTVKVGAKIPATLNGDAIASGDYQIVATVASVTVPTLTESTLADNTATGSTVTIAAPFVDLAIVSATQNFFTPAANGATAAGTVILRNMGNVAVQGNVPIQFFGTPFGSLVPALLGTRTFSVNLPPGAVSPPLSEVLTLNVPNDGMAATPVVVAARIDPASFVDANAGNNQLGAGTVLRSAQYVDLTVYSATNPFSGSQSLGATGTGEVVVGNIGSGVSSGVVTVSYFAVQNGTNTRTLLGSQTASIVLGLAQISSPIDVALLLPAGGTLVSGGSYTLQATITAALTLDNNPNDNVTTSLGTFSIT